MKGVLKMVAVILALLLITVAYWLVATDQGMERLVRSLQPLVPELSLDGLDGNLRDGLQLQQLDWRDDDIQVELRGLQAQLDLWALWTQGIRLPRLSADSLTITLSGDTDTPATEQAIELPAISMPLGLSIDDLQLARLAIVSDGSPFEIEQLRTRLRWRGSELQISRLQATLLDTRLTGKARLAMRGAYRLRGELELDHPSASAAVQLSGSLRQLQLQARIQAQDIPVTATAHARIDTLEPQIPIRATLALDRPWPTEAGELDSASLSIEGQALGLLQGQLEGRFTPSEAYGTTPFSLATALRYQGDQLDISDLRLIRPGQQLQADCTQLLSEPIALDCSGTLAMEHFSPWLSEPAVDLQAPWQLRLAFDPDWQLKIDIPTLTGHWQQRSIDGGLSLTASAELIGVDRLLLQVGSNVLDVSGSMGLQDAQQNTLNLDLNAPNLTQLRSQLAGAATATLQAGGSLSQPDVRGRIQTTGLLWEDFSLRAATLEIEMAKAAQAPSRLHLSLEDIAGQGDLTLLLSGTRATHRLELNGHYLEHADLSLDCRGGENNLLWSLRCGDLSLTWLDPDPDVSFSALQPIQLQWQIDTSAVALQPFCLSSADGARLCLNKPFTLEDGTPSALDAEAAQLALAWLNTSLPPNWQFTGDSRFAARATIASWQPLSLQATVETGRVQAQWSGSETPVELVYDQLAVSLAGDAEQLQLSLQARSTQLGSVEGSLQVTQPYTDRGLDGQVAIRNLDLAALSWAAPDVEDLRGAIDGQLTVAGTTESPHLEGRITLRDGGAVLPMLTDPLGIDLVADFDMDRARLRGRFVSGEGSGSLEGSVAWPQDAPLRAELAVQAQRLSLAPLPDSLLTVSPALQLSWGEPSPGQPETLSLTGRIQVDSAQIVLQDLPENAVQVSSDTVLVGEEAPAEQETIPIQAQLTLALGDQFHFKGLGAEARLAGSLDISYASDTAPQAQGEITIPQGRYRAYGQRLSVRRGSVVFAGDATSPDLDIEATRDLNRRDITVGIRITGNPRNPYAQLFSEPAMPETTIAYYLLTGNPPGEGTAGSDIVAENILTSLGLAGAESPATRLAERIGVRDLQLGTGTGAYGTEAQISAYVLPRLYVRYGVSLEQDAASVTLQYQLTSRLFLEAVSGLDNALDLIYTFERQRPKAAATDRSDGE